MDCKTGDRRFQVFVTGIAVGLSVILTGAAAPQSQRLETILDRAAVYLESYGRSVSGVVAEENYLQEVRSLVPTQGVPAPPTSERSRQLLSDFSFLADPREGWIEFRDVRLVNGRAVGQPERVIEMLAKPNPDAVLQAKRIVEYGARYNLVVPAATIERTINLPMSALLFLKRQYQKRSAFTLGRTDRLDGVNTIVVQFQETATPRIIGSETGGPATGQFWIEPDTGTVIQSELKFSTGTGSKQTRATIRVRYAPQPRLGLTLPVSMYEEYEGGPSSGQVIIGCRAVYDKYRRFDVGVDLNFIKAPVN